MSGRIKSWLWAGAVAALLAACAAPPRPPLEVNAFGVHVAAEHNGSAITLEPGQALVVHLSTNVSQNQEWSLVDFEPGVLTGPSASAFEREARSSNFSEASGAAVWRFMPAAAGTVTLKFDYRNPRALEPASRTVNYTVTVR